MKTKQPPKQFTFRGVKFTLAQKTFYRHKPVPGFMIDVGRGTDLDGELCWYATVASKAWPALEGMGCAASPECALKLAFMKLVKEARYMQKQIDGDQRVVDAVNGLVKKAVWG